MITLNWTLAVAAAVFLITLFALNGLLFEPLFRVMDERRARTTGLRAKSRGIVDHHRALLNQFEERIREERQRGYKLVEAMRNEALQERQQVLVEARQRMEALLGDAKDKIQGEVAEAQQEIRRDSEEMARILTDRVLQRT